MIKYFNQFLYENTQTDTIGKPAPELPQSGSQAQAETTIVIDTDLSPEFIDELGCNSTKLDTEWELTVCDNIGDVLSVLNTNKIPYTIA